MKIEAKLEELGLTLPQQMKTPPGVYLPFSWVRVHGNRAYISGHGPQNPDGSLAGPFGKVGAEVPSEQAYQAARLTALSMLASLKRALGDLDRVRAWLKVFGMVNSAPGFAQQPSVINGFSDLIIEVYGPEVGGHARSAVGMAELPFGIPVEIEAQVETSGQQTDPEYDHNQYPAAHAICTKQVANKPPEKFIFLYDFREDSVQNPMPAAGATTALSVRDGRRRQMLVGDVPDLKVRAPTSLASNVNLINPTRNRVARDVPDTIRTSGELARRL